MMAARIERINRLVRDTGHLARFVIFGSFVTNNPQPNDVDIFLIMRDTFDISLLTGESRLVFEHTSAQDYFGASVFWLRQSITLEDELNTICQWQIKRDGTRRGIVEIISE